MGAKILPGKKSCKKIVPKKRSIGRSKNCQSGLEGGKT